MSNPWSQAYEELRKPYLEGKMAKKDYDGDGKIESGTDEYMGSRDKAIKKAMAEKGKKKVSEHHQKDADGNVIPHGDGTPSSVEEEQINELSKKTLGGYIKKASKETRGNMVATQHGSGIPKKAKDIKLKQVNKRLKGMEKAGEKLAKEETVNEISMPKNTSYEKMSYKKLKSTHKDFKNMDSKPPRVAVLDKKTGGTVSKPVKFVPDKKPKSKMDEMITLTKGDYNSRNVVGSAYNTAKKKGFDKNIYKAGGGLGSNFLPLVNSNEPEGEMLEAKVDKMVPDHKRSGKRLERYGNPHGSLALGGGIQRDRRADHAARRGKKTKGMKKEDWRTDLGFIEEAKKDTEQKVDGKEGSVKNKVTINPEVQVENALINKIKNDFNIIKKAKDTVSKYNQKLQQNNDEINKVLPGSATLSNNSYEPEGEMVEDAKMGRMTDDALSAAHKKFSGMDQKSPANKFMMKRISKEMNRRKKKVNEELNRNQKPFYQKKYTTGGYKTVGTNKRMNSSSDRKKAGTVDSKASHRSQMKDFADAGIIKKGKSGGGMKKGLASLKKESLLDQVATAFVDEATRMKKEMGYDKGGTKKPTGPKAKDAALDAIKAKYKGQIMRSGSNQPKKVKGAKPSGGGKFKMMADKKKETAADAKKRGFKNTQDYVNTMARYGGKDNYDKGKGLGT